MEGNMGGIWGQEYGRNMGTEEYGDRRDVHLFAAEKFGVTPICPRVFWDGIRRLFVNPSPRLLIKIVSSLV
jgi:hypothetical protein